MTSSSITLSFTLQMATRQCLVAAISFTLSGEIVRQKMAAMATGFESLRDDRIDATCFEPERFVLCRLSESVSRRAPFPEVPERFRHPSR